jgi:RimJ/RimL family protein N-acetyltransferase
MDRDPEVRRFLGGPLDAETHREEVLRNILRGRPEPHASWAIELRDQAGVLGLCGLSPSEETGHTQIGWRLQRAAWGNGIATEAARAVLMRALGPLGIRRVVALLHPDNTASIRVAEKIGMTQTGTAARAGVLQLVFSSEAT